MRFVLLKENSYGMFYALLSWKTRKVFEDVVLAISCPKRLKLNHIHVSLSSVFHISQNRFEISCKLENLHEMSKPIFWENISQCRLLEFLPCMLSGNIKFVNEKVKTIALHQVKWCYQTYANFAESGHPAHPYSLIIMNTDVYQYILEYKCLLKPTTTVRIRLRVCDG